jgi:transposase
MLDRVRIWTLRQAGHTLEEIAASVGVGKSSVQRILKEPPITSPESAPTPASHHAGRRANEQFRKRAGDSRFEVAVHGRAGESAHSDVKLGA